MQRKNFAFKFEWQQAIAYLSPEERLEVYEETIRYARTGRVSFNSGRACVAFNTHILPDFERRRKAAEYRARAKARRQAEAEASNKSGNPDNTDSPIAPAAPAAPNRRERRRMMAEEKRLNKKRQRNRLRVNQGGDCTQKKILPPEEQNPHCFFDSFFTCL